MRNQLAVYDSLMEFRRCQTYIVESMEYGEVTPSENERNLRLLKDSLRIFDSAIRVGFHSERATEEDYKNLRSASILQELYSMLPKRLLP